MRKKRRWLKRILYGLIGLIIALMLIALYLGYSETGLKLALRVAKSYAPGLAVKDVSGNLFQQAIIGTVTYDMPGMTITGHQVKVHWELRALLNKPFHAYAKWQSLSVARAHQAPIFAENGHIVMDGRLSDYRLAATADVASENIPTGKWQLHGTGNLSAFNIAQLKLLIHPGHLSISGPVTWAPNISWKLNVSGDNINPGVFIPRLTGKINLNLDTTGNYGTQLENASVIIHKLSGQYLKHPLTGLGTFHYQDNGITVKQLKLQLGQNAFSANGKIAKQSALQWRLHLLDLNNFFPTYHGTLDGQGTISGDINTPTIKATINANELDIASVHIRKIVANANIDTQLQQDSHLQIQANGFNVPGTHLKALNLQANGNRSGHKIALIADIHNEQLIINSHGHYNKNQLAETIDRFTLTNKIAGNWQLQENPQLNISNTDFVTTPFCWQSDQHGSLCLNGSWHQHKPWQLRLSTAQFNLALFNTLLPNSLELNSHINTQLQLGGKGLKNLHGKLEMTFPKMHMAYGETLNNQLALDGSEIQANLSRKHGLTAKAKLTVGQGKLPIDATVALPDFKGDVLPNNNSPINGKLQIHWHTLQTIAQAVPVITVFKGELNTLIKLSGTIGNPDIDGHVQLNNAEIGMDSLGLLLKNVSLQSTIKNDIAKLKLQLQSEKGILKGQGELNLLDPANNLQLNLQGNDVTAMNNAQYHVRISPQLKLVFTPNKQTLTGSVSIPYARIKPEDYGSTVTLPDNFTVINQQGQVESTTAAPLHMDLHIKLGKDIRLNYSNLVAKLGGQVHIKAKPGQAMTGNGKIIVIEGKYEAYGHKLTTKHGIVTFDGGPISNPSLDILAVRTIPVYGYAGSNATTEGNIIAGVSIIGPVNDLKISLYSEPPMSQSNIMSYLLFGKPSTAVNGDSSAVLSQALLMLSSGSGTGNVLEKTKKNLGLDTLGVESSQVYSAQGPQSSTSFVVGKKLSKRLEALYSAGITIPINVIILRYQLSKSWRLQSESSNYENGADVFYTFETD